MIQDKLKKETDLTKLFILNNYDSDDSFAYMEEIGTLIFQSALMLYITSQSDADVAEFEEYISTNITSETFIDDLCLLYPIFKELLIDEIKAFHSEIYSK